jgi:hypothetical protein
MKTLLSFFFKSRHAGSRAPILTCCLKTALAAPFHSFLILFHPNLLMQTPTLQKYDCSRLGLKAGLEVHQQNRHAGSRQVPRLCLGWLRITQN